MLGRDTAGEDGTAVVGRGDVLGAVEACDPRVGVTGWLARPEPDAGPAVAELVAGGTVLASVRADMLRPELRALVPAHLADEPWAGFRFPTAALAMAAALAAEERGVPLHVRDAASGERLPGPDLPTGDEIAAALAEADDAPRAATPPPSGPFTPRELVDALELVRLDAGALATAPLAFSDAAQRGSVEVVVRIARGLFVVGGWAIGAVPRHGPALILLDGRKVAAATHCALYTRPDLPPGAVAFVAVMRTDADIGRPGQDFILSFGEADRFMRSRRPVNLLAVGQGLAWLANATRISDAEKELIAEVARLEVEGPVAPEAMGCQVSIDRVVLFPGFGALVRGWLLSPVAELRAVSVLQAGARADASRERIATASRPDLAAGFPQFADRTARAGFAAVCVGPLPFGERERPAVVLALDDGSELAATVPLQQVRSGYAPAALEELARDFPAYASEAFFPALCRAYATALRRGRPTLHHLLRSHAAGAPDTLLLHMPLPRSDARFALTDVARSLDGLDGVSVRLLIGPDHDRTAVVRAVADVLPDRGLSVTQHDGRADLARVVARALADAGADRFAFVQAGCRLDERGWAALRRFFDGQADRPLALALEDPDGASTPGPAGLGALAWRAAAFADHAGRAAPDARMLGRDLLSLPGIERVNGAVGRYHAPHASPLAARVAADVEQVLLATQAS